VRAPRENFSMPRWLTSHTSLVLLCAGCVLVTSAKEARRPGSVFRDCARVCPEMVVVAPGSYLMGSPPEDPHQGKDGEEPPRWPTIMGLNWHNTGFPQSGRDPVVCVSWEYADRAGTQSQAYWGDVPNEACKYANGVDATLSERFPKGRWEDRVPCHDGHVFTAPVGSYQPNAFGLYDMQGNAFEWVEDCWADNYRGASADGSARTADADCGNRVNRGGSWTSIPSGLRSVTYDALPPSRQST
jgi:formylglycine-generating enzyme required for sulfatase activity